MNLLSDSGDKKITSIRNFESKSSYNSFFENFVMRLVRRKSDCVVALSKGVEEDLIDNCGVPKKIVTTIYNPSLVLNIVISIVLMYMGMSIQIVKLASAGIFVLQPLVCKYAVDHRFNIDRNIALNGEPIKQKWNGLAQHLATVILENTDVLVLTFFSTLSSVSVYSVYHG